MDKAEIVKKLKKTHLGEYFFLQHVAIVIILVAVNMDAYKHFIKEVYLGVSLLTAVFLIVYEELGFNWHIRITNDLLKDTGGLAGLYKMFKVKEGETIKESLEISTDGDKEAIQALVDFSESIKVIIMLKRIYFFAGLLIALASSFVYFLQH